MVLKRHFQPPHRSFFLFGPRGTGKSTWIHELYPQALKLDLLDPKIYREYQAYPEHLGEILLAAKTKQIVIDEVQRIPELLSVVHRWIEKKQGYQFVLTGSSSRKLKKSGTDLLAGRAIKKILHPFIASELKQAFQLDKALTLGMLPLVFDSSDQTEVLQTYIDLYLDEEVAKEGWVRNLGQFSRFLQAMSFSHANILNLNNISRDCEVKRPTVEGYLEVLEDLLLAYRIPVFEKRAQRKMSQHPKFFYFDTGVYVALRPKGPLDKPEEIHGAALEGLVAQHLKAWIDYSDTDAGLFFWRTLAGSEVDFVVYGKNIFVGIEVKNNKKIYPQDLRHLKSFQKDYPEAEAICCYRGQERFVRNGILCIPCEEFLLGIKPNQSLVHQINS